MPDSVGPSGQDPPTFTPQVDDPSSDLPAPKESAGKGWGFGATVQWISSMLGGGSPAQDEPVAKQPVPTLPPPTDDLSQRSVDVDPYKKSDGQLGDVTALGSKVGSVAQVLTSGAQQDAAEQAQAIAREVQQQQVSTEEVEQQLGGLLRFIEQNPDVDLQRIYETDTKDEWSYDIDDFAEESSGQTIFIDELERGIAIFTRHPESGRCEEAHYDLDSLDAATCSKIKETASRNQQLHIAHAKQEWKEAGLLLESSSSDRKYSFEGEGSYVRLLPTDYSAQVECVYYDIASGKEKTELIDLAADGLQRAEATIQNIQQRQQKAFAQLQPGIQTSPQLSRDAPNAIVLSGEATECSIHSFIPPGRQAISAASVPLSQAALCKAAEQTKAQWALHQQLTEMSSPTLQVVADPSQQPLSLLGSSENGLPSLVIVCDYENQTASIAIRDPSSKGNLLSRDCALNLKDIQDNVNFLQETQRFFDENGVMPKSLNELYAGILEAKGIDSQEIQAKKLAFEKTVSKVSGLTASHDLFSSELRRAPKVLSLEEVTDTVQIEEQRVAVLHPSIWKAEGQLKTSQLATIIGQRNLPELQVLSSIDQPESEIDAAIVNEGVCMERKVLDAIRSKGLTQSHLVSGRAVSVVTGGRHPTAFLTEFCDGGGLMDAQSKPAHVRLELARQAAVGVSALHDEVEVIHGDLTKNNILLKTNGKGEPEVRIIDFGTATEVKGRGFPSGSPSYWPSEMALSPGYVNSTTKSDVYALGVNFLELVCATDLRAEASDTLEVFAQARMRNYFSLIEEQHEGVMIHAPEGYEDSKMLALLGEMLHTDAAKRPTAAQAAERLRDICADPQEADLMDQLVHSGTNREVLVPVPELSEAEKDQLGEQILDAFKGKAEESDGPF